MRRSDAKYLQFLLLTSRSSASSCFSFVTGAEPPHVATTVTLIRYGENGFGCRAATRRTTVTQWKVFSPNRTNSNDSHHRGIKWVDCQRTVKIYLCGWSLALRGGAREPRWFCLCRCVETSAVRFQEAGRERFGPPWRSWFSMMETPPPPEGAGGGPAPPWRRRPVGARLFLLKSLFPEWYRSHIPHDVFGCFLVFLSLFCLISRWK